MRWLRWAAGVGAVLVLAGLFFGEGFSSSISCNTMAIVPSATFVGEVVAIDGSTVTYRVDEVLDAPVDLTRPTPAVAVGQEAVVHYSGGDERFLDTGERYRVDVYGSSDDLRSGVHNAGECTNSVSGTGTVHADGTAIDTKLLSSAGLRPYLPKLAITIVAAAAIALLVRWRIRVKHPRLTIDGQPLTKR